MGSHFFTAANDGLFGLLEVQNSYGGMHGGAVAAVAERVAIACARTVVGIDKDIFLGELSISYLYAAPHKVSLCSFSENFIFFTYGLIDNPMPNLWLTISTL